MITSILDHSNAGKKLGRLNETLGGKNYIPVWAYISDGHW